MTAEDERVGKPAKKDAAERGNKKAEVVAMMKRAKGATLAEIPTALCSSIGGTRMWL